MIDIGSGKGYLSSFLSMQYNLKVYGIDSSNTNTNGAHERNRKLKKHWRAYQSRARANPESQRLEKANDSPVQNEIKCKAVNERTLNNSCLQSQDQRTTQDLVPSCVFTEAATSETSKQTEIDLVAQAKCNESRLSEETLAILDVLPANAVEIFSSSQCNSGELCEEEKAKRKMASIKAKASKSSESNLYFPLTSYVTAETELGDIITDLEVMLLIFEIYCPLSLYCCFHTYVIFDECT